MFGFDFIVNNSQHIIPAIKLKLLILSYLAGSYIVFKTIRSVILQYINTPKGKHCLITGASQGLGRSLALKLAKQGAHVTVVARTESLLKSLVEEMKSIAPHYYNNNNNNNNNNDQKQMFNYIVCDALNVQDSIKSIHTAKKLAGKCPEWVFTIAGASVPGYMLESLEIENYKSQMNLNYFGTLHTVKEASKVMVQDKVKDGKIVLCSSQAALVGFLGYTAYSPSKAAIKSFAECLRQEMLMYGITVHCAFPGSILTKGFEEENKIKPRLTREIEGDDGQTPEMVADGMLKGIAKGESFIVTDLMGEFFLSINYGFAPVNNYLIYGISQLLSWIICPGLRIFVDLKARGELKNLKKKQ